MWVMGHEQIESKRERERKKRDRKRQKDEQKKRKKDSCLLILTSESTSLVKNEIYIQIKKTCTKVLQSL
jgi:hypothetical protein